MANPVTNYNIYSYVKGINGFGLPFSNTTVSTVMGPSTVATCAVPDAAGAGVTGATVNKYIAIFSYAASETDGVWVAVNATATLPAAGNIFTACAGELNPKAKYVKAGDVLSFISIDAAIVGVAFFAIQEG